MVQVHFIAPVTLHQRVLHHLSTGLADTAEKGRIHRRLYDHSLPGLGKGGGGSVQGWYHPGGHANPVPLYAPVVMLAKPLHQRVVQAVRKQGVAISRVFSPPRQRLGDGPGGGKIRIGYPQGDHILAAKHSLAGIELDGMGPAPGKHLIKRVGHYRQSSCWLILLNSWRPERCALVPLARDHRNLARSLSRGLLARPTALVDGKRVFIPDREIS